MNVNHEKILPRQKNCTITSIN